MSKVYLCSPKKVEGCEYLPMIKFKQVANSIDLIDIDAIIFTSKQAVIYADKLNKSWKSKYILAVGKATANIAKELGATQIYTPNEFYGKELAKDIINNFSDKKIVYLRPKEIAFDSVKFLQNEGLNVREKIIYETNCIEYNNSFNIEKNSIIIFTSPSTIKCFFNNFKWDKSYKAVVIGRTTLKNLPNNIVVKVATKPTIDSCIKMAQNLQKS